MIAEKIRDNLTFRPSSEEQREKDEKKTVWVFVWTLFFFKLATLVAIIWAASGSSQDVVMVIATNWFWLLIPAFAISGPAIYHLRLRRVRRRRAAMVRSEWMLD